jgi:DNA-binding NtrC family response regulator
MKKDILIVDDDEDILTVLGYIFTDLGWETYVAKNAKDALELFKKITPPLVLTDLLLQDGIGGVNICKKVKNISPLTFVVAISGSYSESYSISHLRRSGFDHFVPKPFKHEQFKEMIETVIMCRESWDELVK